MTRCLTLIGYPPEWFIGLGWASEDKAFVALAGASCECLRLCGGIGVLADYRAYNEERIAQQRAQAERDAEAERDYQSNLAEEEYLTAHAVPSSPEEIHTD